MMQTYQSEYGEIRVEPSTVFIGAWAIYLNDIHIGRVMEIGVNKWTHTFMYPGTSSESLRDAVDSLITAKKGDDK